jgi:hypothetical protein
MKSWFGPRSRASHNKGISKLTSASKFVTSRCYFLRDPAPVQPAPAGLAGEFESPARLHRPGGATIKSLLPGIDLTLWTTGPQVTAGGDYHGQIKFVLQTISDDVNCHTDISLLFLVRHPPVPTSITFLIPVAEFADVNFYASCL